jgi:hypothetical protein
MTDTLREALREAAYEGSRPEAGTTGRELLRRGRQKARRRTIFGTAAGAVALVAAIGVPLTTSTQPDTSDQTAPHHSAGPSHSAAPSETATGPASGFTRAADLKDVCVGIDRIADWTVRAVVYSNGVLTAVMTSPDGTMFADCVGSGDSATASIPLRPNVEDDPGYTSLRNRHWYDDSCARTENPCHWGGSGQISTEVARMVFESSDGQTYEADVNDGYFAWQSEVTDVDVMNQPLMVTLYDADDKLIDRVNANPHPSDW